MRITSYIISIIAALLITSCGKNGNDNGSKDSAGNGNDTISKSFTITDFNGIDIEGAASIHFTQGDKYAITAKGKQKDISLLELTKKNRTLVIKKKIDKEKLITINTSDIHLYITAPEMEKVRIIGSGDFICQTPLNAGKFSAIIAGSGDVHMGKITTEALESKIAGSGDIVIEHAITSGINLDIAGSGDINISMENSGDVISYISGSGDITLRGQTMGERHHVSGSGDVNTDGLEVKNKQE